MDQPIIPYENWPKWVKILTATCSKELTVKNPKQARGLVGFTFGLGFLALGLPFLLDNIYDRHSHSTFLDFMDFISLCGGFLALVSGVFNLTFTVKAYDWIKDNSTWDERFSNSSSTKNKLIVVAILVGFCLASYLLAWLFQGIIR